METPPSRWCVSGQASQGWCGPGRFLCDAHSHKPWALDPNGWRLITKLLLPVVDPMGAGPAGPGVTDPVVDPFSGPGPDGAFPVAEHPRPGPAAAVMYHPGPSGGTDRFQSRYTDRGGDQAGPGPGPSRYGGDPYADRGRTGDHTGPDRQHGDKSMLTNARSAKPLKRPNARNPPPVKVG